MEKIPLRRFFWDTNIAANFPDSETEKQWGTFFRLQALLQKDIMVRGLVEEFGVYCHTKSKRSVTLHSGNLTLYVLLAKLNTKQKS